MGDLTRNPARAPTTNTNTDQTEYIRQRQGRANAIYFNILELADPLNKQKNTPKSIQSNTMRLALQHGRVTQLSLTLQQQLAITNPEIFKIIVNPTLYPVATPASRVSGPSVPQSGYNILVWDSANRLYLADSNLQSFTLITSTAVGVTNTSFGCNDGLVRFVSGSTWLGTNGAVLYKSINNGLTWTSLYTFPAGLKDMIAEDLTATTIYVSSNSRFYRSTDGGTTFTELKYAAPSGNMTSFSKQGSIIVWAGIYNGDTWSSTDGGTTFAKVNFPISQYYGIDVIYFNGNFCLFMDNGTSSYRLVSSDGVNWTATTVATPFFFTRGTVRDPISGTIVIAVGTNGSGTAPAIIYSLDNGLTFNNATGSVVGKTAYNSSGYPSRLGWCGSIIHFSGSLFIIRCYDSSIHTSPDGITWSTAPLSPDGSTLAGFGIAYNDSTNQIR